MLGSQVLPACVGPCPAGSETGGARVVVVREPEQAQWSHGR